MIADNTQTAITYPKHATGHAGDNNRLSIDDRLKASLEFGRKRIVQQELIAGYVYLFECDGFIKIGKAKDVQDRLSGIQGANPHKVKLIASKESLDPITDEKELHRIYHRFRVRGEWFKIPEELIPPLLELFSQNATMFSEAYPIKRRPRKRVRPIVLEPTQSEKETLKYLNYT